MSVTLLKITAGYTFTGIAPKGYKVQPPQPVVISESVTSAGFTKRKLGANKVGMIEVTFACSSETETAANLAALDSTNGKLQFDYWSPRDKKVMRSYFLVFVDSVTVIRNSSGDRLYDTWKVTLEQATVTAAAVPITTSVTRYPTAHTSATWSNPAHAYADDAAYAWTHGTKDAYDDILLRGFSFPEIPAGAVIDSVVCEMNYRVSNTSSSARVGMLMTHNDVVMGGGWGSTAEPTSWTKVSTANNGIWTPAMINDGTMKVLVRVERTGASATPYYGLDYVKVTVTYTVYE
jgi:hypothetical protein